MTKVTDSKSKTGNNRQNKPANGTFFAKEKGGESTFFGEKEAGAEPFFVQRKLTVGKPDDHYEKQADQVADKVVQRMSQPNVQAKTATAPVTMVPSGHVPSSAARNGTLQKKEQETIDEEPAGEEQLRRKPIFDSMGDPPDDIQKKDNGTSGENKGSDDMEQRLQQSKGSGSPLPSDTRMAMESSIGADFSSVRIHTGREAAEMSNELNAQAFTHGNDIYFNDNKFDAASNSGKHLLAHELTHTVQQGAAVQKKADPEKEEQADEEGVPELQKQGIKEEEKAGPDVQKQEAIGQAEEEKGSPDIQKQEAISGGADDDTLQLAPAPATGNKPGGKAPAAVPGEVVDVSSGKFNTTAGLAEAISAAGTKGMDVNIHAGRIAGAGILKVRKMSGKLESVKNAYLPLNMPMFSAANPMLAVKLENGEVTGFGTIGQSNLPDTIPKWLRKNGKALGWLTGIDVENIGSGLNNKFANGSFAFTVSGVKAKVGGFASATMDLGFVDAKPSAQVIADVDIAGVAKGDLTITLMEDKMSGEGSFGVVFKGFSGEVSAKFKEGVFDVKGQVGYSGDRLSGSVMLLMTDKKTADNFAVTQLGGVPAEQAEMPASVPAPAEGKGPRALAGMGTLTFNMTEWFAGSVNVIIDGKGFVTVVGKIAPPKEIILFQQKDYSKELFKMEARAAYGLPVIGNVFVFANMALIALAKVGPAKIYNIEIEGTYSNNPDIAKHITLSGSLNMSAYAGLRLRAEGGAGIEILGHDLKVGVGINADAGVKGYVDARPTIGYRDPGEFFFKGHMEIAAQPFLGLSGDLFVEVDSPWWSPLPDKKWKWPIGALEYPLPGEFGIGADMEYVLGSGKVPEVTFSEASFDGTKFMTDLVDDHVPQKSGQGDKQKQGKFTDGGGAGAAPAKGAPPAPAKGKPAAGGGKGTPGAPGKGGAGAPGKGGAGGKGKGKDKAPADPEMMKNFAAAMQKVKALEGHKPMTKEEITSAIEGIKKQHKVTGITFAPKGSDQWLVTGSIKGQPNKQSVKVKAKMKPGDEKNKKGDEKDKAKKLSLGLEAIDTEEKKYLTNNQIAKEEAEKVAQTVKGKHPVFKSITITDGGDSWDYNYIQAAKKKGEKKEVPDKDEVLKLLKAHFGNKKFAVREYTTFVTKQKVPDKLGRQWRDAWIKDKVLFEFSSGKSRDSHKSYCFDDIFKGKKRDIKFDKRSEYGYANFKKTSDTAISVLQKSIIKDPKYGWSPGLEKQKSYLHSAQARYTCKRSGKIVTFANIALGHDEKMGASEHWKEIGHKQTKAQNIIWNNDPNNYWGIEDRKVSKLSGNEAPLYIEPGPPNHPDSHEMWWNEDHEHYFLKGR